MANWVNSYETAYLAAHKDVPRNRQGLPCFLGSSPARGPEDLAGGDVAILGVPFYTPAVGYENDIAPRKVRLASLCYVGSYIAELDVDPAEKLRIFDYGDVDIPFGNATEAMRAVMHEMNAVLEAGCVPVTIGGNAPVGSYAVIHPIAQHTKGGIAIIHFDAHTDTEPQHGDEPGVSNWLRSAYLQIANLSTRNHVQVGMRGMSNTREDMAFFRERNMRTIMAREVARMGSQRLAEEAVAHAGDGTDAIWCAIDMDVLDACEVPDWDFPDPYGVRVGDILETVYAAGCSGKLCGISLMMLSGQSYWAQRIATWIVLYGLAGMASAR